MREKWDRYFYNICKVIENNSKCLSRKIGSILVRENSLISSGYNGPARGIPHCNERFIIDPDLRAMLKSKHINPDDPSFHNTCPRYIAGFKSGEGLEICIAGHSERNTIINAAREGTSTKGTILYMSCGIPCKDCLTEIINAGVKEIVVTKFEFYDSTSKYLLENSSLKYRVYDHLKDN